jgi:hypothetical protein
MSDPYIASLGRISGPLLSDNLIRNGYDLTFRNGPTDTDLLYLDVTNKRISLNKDAPAMALEVVGDGKVTQDFIVTGTSATLNEIVFNTNGTVTSVLGPIIIQPTGPDAYVRYGKVLNTQLELKDNYIKVSTTNTNLALEAHGTGVVDFQRTANVTGDVEVTGAITSGGDVRLNGQFIIGDSPIDTVSIQPDFTQDLIPGASRTYDLGASDKAWESIYLIGIPGAENVVTQQVLVSDQLLLSGNTVSSVESNDNLIFMSDSGNIKLENFVVNNNVITNSANNTPTIFYSTATGYLKVADASGMRIPVGTDGQRGFTEVGETRWNTTQGWLECYDGNVYQVATGGGVVITPKIMEELGDVYALMLG